MDCHRLAHLRLLRVIQDNCAANVACRVITFFSVASDAVDIFSQQSIRELINDIREHAVFKVNHGAIKIDVGHLSVTRPRVLPVAASTRVLESIRERPVRPEPNERGVLIIHGQ